MNLLKSSNILIYILIISFTLVIPNGVFAQNLQRDAVQTADSLYEALKAGNTREVEAILDPQVLVFESGFVEASFEEYASEHLGADIEYMKTVEREILSRNVYAQGDITVIATRARFNSTYNDKTTVTMSNETLVLKRKQQGWLITHIHWSSKKK